MKTDDLLDPLDVFAARLRDGLQHIAESDPVVDPGRFDPDVVHIGDHGDIRARHWLVGVAAAAVVAVGVGGVVALDRNDPAEDSTTDQPEVATAVTESGVLPDDSSASVEAPLFATPLSADQVPVVAFDGATTTYAYSQHYPGPFGGGFAGATVLVPAAGSFGTPRVAIDVVERSAANGNQILDLAQLGAPIEVAGTTGYITTEPTDSATGENGPVQLLFFDLDPQRYVRVNAVGIGVDEMVSIVNTYDPATGAVEPPDGLVELEMPSHDINQTVEFTYDVAGRQVGLQGSSRGAEFLLEMIADSMTSTQVINGVEAFVQSNADNQWSVYWMSGNWAFSATFSNVDDPAMIPDLLNRFRLVDDSTFATMYEGGDVVTDSNRPATVAAMITDVELPPAVSVSDLANRRGANERYQEVVAVSSAIACSWLEVYFDNVNTDPATAQAAADSLAASTGWDMLQEIEDQGGWSNAVWEAAAAINGNGPIPDGTDGQAPTRENTYPGLGCDTR